MAAQVHHVRDRRLVGDDPRYLQAAHRLCNQKAGQPGKTDAEHTMPAWLAARLAADADDHQSDVDDTQASDLH
jgi:5-methylcytosine-specific restriction endonuclease McrA